MKQTAVDYLFERLSTLYLFKDALLAQRALQEAKAMEKEQIIESWIATDNELQRMKAEQYYNETFKSE